MFFDLHLHLLPFIDDGAIDTDEALDMLEVLIECGWSGAALTPHIRMDYFPNEPGKIVQEARFFIASLESYEIDFDLRVGAEHYLDDQVFRMLLDGNGVPLGGEGSVFLVEFPMQGWMPNIVERVFELKMKGVTPLIAHPERCIAFHDIDTVRRAVDSGAMFQMNIMSLIGVYGRQARSVANKILSLGLYSCAATDLHYAENAQDDLMSAIDSLDRIIGTDARNILMSDNPRRILSGETPFVVSGVR